MRKGGFDFINELEYQFGTMASGQTIGNIGANTQDVHINAWATRNWLGYTMYENKWKPRFAVGSTTLLATGMPTVTRRLAEPA